MKNDQITWKWLAAGGKGWVHEGCWGEGRGTGRPLWGRARYRKGAGGKGEVQEGHWGEGPYRNLFAGRDFDFSLDTMSIAVIT